MLTVLYKLKHVEYEQHCVNWHIYETVPPRFIDDTYYTVVLADGDELNWIRKHLKNIPIHDKLKKQRWDGVFARFIYNSLPRSDDANLD